MFEHNRNGENFLLLAGIKSVTTPPIRRIVSSAALRRCALTLLKTSSIGLKHGRFYSKAKDCARCPLRGDCLYRRASEQSRRGQLSRMGDRRRTGEPMGKVCTIGRHCNIVIAFLALIATYEPAWSFEKSGMFWHIKSPEFVVCLDSAPTGAMDVLKEAGKKWSYSKFEFKFAAPRCLRDPSWRQPDGTNYIAFGEVEGGDRGNDTAESFSRNEPATDKMIECDIRFNKNRDWYSSITGSPGSKNDLLSVAMHEFGHCLGLDHSAVADVVMSDVLQAGKMRRSLTGDDINGRNSLYGAP